MVGVGWGWCWVWRWAGLSTSSVSCCPVSRPRAAKHWYPSLSTDIRTLLRWWFLMLNVEQSCPHCSSYVLSSKGKTADNNASALAPPTCTSHQQQPVEPLSLYFLSQIMDASEQFKMGKRWKVYVSSFSAKYNVNECKTLYFCCKGSPLIQMMLLQNLKFSN